MGHDGHGARTRTAPARAKHGPNGAQDRPQVDAAQGPQQAAQATPRVLGLSGAIAATTTTTTTTISSSQPEAPLVVDVGHKDGRHKHNGQLDPGAWRPTAVHGPTHFLQGHEVLGVVKVSGQFLGPPHELEVTPRKVVNHHNHHRQDANVGLGGFHFLNGL